jgi:DNA-binding MarR family transcriptional regulator
MPLRGCHFKKASLDRLTKRSITSIIEILLYRTNRRAAAKESLDKQSERLLGYLDALFNRMVFARHQMPPGPDLSKEEMRTLWALGIGEARKMSELAELLNVPLSTATNLVDRLCERALVVRTRSDKDRRVVEVQMSPQGKRRQAAARALRLAMAKDWLEPLDEGERHLFLHLTGKIAGPAQEGKK